MYVTFAICALAVVAIGFIAYGIIDKSRELKRLRRNQDVADKATELRSHSDQRNGPQSEAERLTTENNNGL
jgi:uncharacterized membrane protein YcjF (UPF0283 family)